MTEEEDYKHSFFNNAKFKAMVANGEHYYPTH